MDLPESVGVFRFGDRRAPSFIGGDKPLQVDGTLAAIHSEADVTPIGGVHIARDALANVLIVGSRVS